jgi:hypothetical protein
LIPANLNRYDAWRVAAVTRTNPTTSGETKTMYRHAPTCLEGSVFRNRLECSFAAWEPLAQGSVNGDGLRHDLIARVRRAIAAGTYDTPEKWEAALDRLAAQLEESI